MDSFKEKINDLIAAPEYQDQANYQLLQEQVGNYPYCQSLRLAIARHSKVFKLANAESLVALAAIYAPDRIVLFNLMGLPGKNHAQEPTATETNGSSSNTDKEQREHQENINFADASSTNASESTMPVPEIAVPSVESDATAVERAAVDFESAAPAVKSGAQAAESAAIAVESRAQVAESAAIAVESRAQVAESAATVSKSFKQEPVNMVPEGTHWAAKKAALDRKVADEAPVRKTFLYWLKKTQKGYFLNSTNTDNSLPDQPEVLKTSTLPDPLEQHYQANTFVLPVNESAENTQAIEFDPNKKEDQLIKQYLTEDPQHIKPNHPLNDQDKVDMLVERASKDAGIVTETLAAIYYQQKQYEKALKAYDDLRLKFPNKSAYFADLHEKIRNEVADNK